MGKALELSLAVPSGGSLEAYLQAVHTIPMLSEDEERQLAEQFRDHEDLESARRLVLSHLRFVARVARGYSGYGLPQADLIQEGNVGLMKAVKRFDPTLGVRLVSFAVHWIRPRSTNTSCATGASSRSRPPRPSASSSSTCAAPRSASAG